ncbi:MAG TPA: hypothetical protein VE690_14375 [Rhodopila sp.]|nr:hypothetical protein [Rhodopila sp.]
MYRCYVIHNGRIARAEELSAIDLDEAVTQGRALLAADPQTTTESGIEIWHRADLLYSDKRHAVDTGRPAHILSPFAPDAASF